MYKQAKNVNNIRHACSKLLPECWEDSDIVLVLRKAKY